MADTSPQTLSGKVRVNPPLSASSDRYVFLNTANSEPNLSLPVQENNLLAQYVLLSDPLIGTRTWSTSATIALSGDRVGIGTSSPNEKLTVVGNISATGIIYGTVNGPVIPAAAGSNDMVQYNSSGYLAANPAFVFKPTLSALQVGTNNSTTGNYSSILGGSGNIISNNLAVIAGGDQNTNNGASSVVMGGTQNLASGDYVVIAGGRTNDATNTYAAIGGGIDNSNGGFAGVIAGGSNNQINPTLNYGGVLGGANNVVAHDNAYVVGSNITTVSANFTHVEGLNVGGHIVLNQSIAEKFTGIAPVAGVVTIDLSTGTTFNILLTANVTSFNILNYVDNKANSFIIFPKQDGAGGKSVVWSFTGKTLKWSAGNAPSVSSGAGQEDVMTFISNNGGNTWYGFIGGQNFF